MKETYIFSALCSALVLSVLFSSCIDKKPVYKKHMSIEEAPPQEQKQLQKVQSQTDEPKNPEPGHEYLNGKDITDNKQTCTMCGGSGRQNGGKCQGCQGYGYILVYK